MLKERIGGTEGEVAKREEARRIVPSPPNVVIRSTLFGSSVDVELDLGEDVVDIGDGAL
jgi:hypothetical protein